MADEVEVKPEEAQDQLQDKAIEVDLNKKPESEKKPESSEPKYVTVEDLEKVRKQLNGLSYISRQFNEVSKKLDSLQLQPQRTSQAGVSQDPYDELVEKDWKAAVRTLAREEAEAIRQQTIQLESMRQMENKKISILEESKQRVRERFPDLDDPNSEVAKRYMNILNKNQDYLRNERGPLLAMRDMEDEFKAEGRLDEFSKKAVEKEVARQVRAGATAGVKTQSSNGNGNKWTLTREQKEICDNNNIRYETYALMLKKQAESGSRQVEV